MSLQTTDHLKTFNDVLEHIYYNKLYKNYANTFFKNDSVRSEELFSSFIERLIDMPTKKVLELCKNNSFTGYAIMIIRNEAVGHTSKYNKYSRDRVEEVRADRYMLEEVELTHFNQAQTEELLVDMYNHVFKLAEESTALWYDAQVYKLYYYEYRSFRKFSEASNIPVSALYHSINNTRRRLRKKFGANFLNIDKNGND